MLKRLLFLLAMLSPALAFAATPNITVNLVPVVSTVHVVSVLLNGGSSASYASGISSGTSIAPIEVTMSNGSTYTGAVALSGSAAADFTATNTSLNANGSTPTCTASTPHSITISAPPGRGETGATVSIQATVTCNPSGTTIACDIGPNYTGVIPAAAQAAGFTHCAANYDFTYTGSFTNNGHSHTWSTLSSWLGCAGASNLLWNLDHGVCSDVSMITDGGKQTLDVRFNPADFGNPDDSTNLSTNALGNPGDLSGASLTLPTGKYIEYVTRTPNDACPSSKPNCIPTDIFSWGGDSNTGFVEWDFLEVYGDSSLDGGSAHTTNGGASVDNIRSQPREASGWDHTQYNTIGERMATDTGGNLSYCLYVNGSLIPAEGDGSAYDCGTGTYSPVPLGRDDLILLAGPQGTPNFGSTGDLYVQRITVWECSGYATGECYSSTANVTNGGSLLSSP